MNKDLATVNIFTLHQEMLHLTELNEMYCDTNNKHMSDLCLEQMDLLVEEMKQLGQ